MNDSQLETALLRCPSQTLLVNLLGGSWSWLSTAPTTSHQSQSPATCWRLWPTHTRPRDIGPLRWVRRSRCGGNGDRITRHNAVLFSATQSAALRETNGLIPESMSTSTAALQQSIVLESAFTALHVEELIYSLAAQLEWHSFHWLSGVPWTAFCFSILL